MKIANLIIVIILYKISLYQFDIVKQSKKILELSRKKPFQIRGKEFSKSIDQRIFLPSEFPTQINIFRDFRSQISEQRNLDLEQQLTSNRLLDQLKSAQISLELKLIHLFVYRLGNLNELQKELIKAASTEPNRVLNICSPFVMKSKQKLQLTQAIRQKLNTDAQVKFTIMDNSNLGIELRDRGYRIFSSLDACITEIDKKLENQTSIEKSELKQLIRA